MKRVKSFFNREDLFRKWEKVPKQDKPKDERFTAHDVLALIIAALSIVLPWALAVIGALVLIVFLIWMFYLR